MPTSFPAAQQSFSEPAGTAPLSTGHLQHHIDLGDTVEAVQTYTTDLSPYQPVIAINTMRNMILNPITADSTLWLVEGFGTGGSGVTGAIERVGFKNVPAMVYRWTTASTNSGTNTGPNICPVWTNGATVAAGLPYVGSMYLEVSGSASDVVGQALMIFYDAAGTYVGQTGGELFTIRAERGPQRITSLPAMPITGAVRAVPAFRIWTVSQMGTGSLRASAPQIEQATASNPFRHGDMLGASWTGTRLASASQAVLNVRDRIATYGDSHMGQNDDGGYKLPDYLNDALGQEVWNGARGGETSTGVAIRAGAIPVTVTVTGGSIPTTGSVGVTVTVGGANPIFNAALWNFSGSVGGVNGTLTVQADGVTWSFARNNTSAAATAVTGAVPFVPYEVATSTDLWIIHVGVNLPDLNRTVYDIAAMVAKCQAEGREFLVQSLYNNTAQPSGNAGYTLLMAINAELQRRWPQRYVDARRWLIDKGLAAAGLTATGPDLIAIGEDRIPPQLLDTNGIHLTKTARAVVASYLSQYVRNRNLLKPEQPPVDNTIPLLSPRIVVPPASLGGLVASTAWVAANYALGNWFSLATRHTMRYMNIRVGVSSGTIQCGVVRMRDPGPVYFYRVMSSGVIACPAAGYAKVDCGLTVLEPGEYVMFLWCSNVTATFPHANPTPTGMSDARLSVDFGTPVGGVAADSAINGYTNRYLSGMTLTDF